MSEQTVAADRHFVAPLSDQEAHDLKVKVAESGLKQKHWIRMAIIAQLYKEE